MRPPWAVTGKSQRVGHQDMGAGGYPCGPTGRDGHPERTMSPTCAASAGPQPLQLLASGQDSVSDLSADSG
jgi:hypothetical protein